MLIQKTISENFTVLKSISIIFVIASHFMKVEAPILWVPALFGLFIFGYSSAYFTSLKYSGVFSLKTYWMQKLYRLGVSLVVVNLFILCILLIEKRTGIWSWQTLISMIGLGGFITWLRIPNESPFGAGRWFLTLLFLFYICYPIVNAIINNRMRACFFFTVGMGVLLLLNYYVVYEHALWLTSTSFLCGFFMVKSSFKLSKNLSLSATILLIFILIILNYCGQIKYLNAIFFILIFLSFVQYVESVKIVNFIPRSVSGCLFEVYLIHTYLFIRPIGIYYIDFLISICLIIAIGCILSQIAHYLRKFIFQKENRVCLVRD